MINEKWHKMKFIEISARVHYKNYNFPRILVMWFWYDYDFSFVGPLPYLKSKNSNVISTTARKKYLKAVKDMKFINHFGCKDSQSTCEEFM